MAPEWQIGILIGLIAPAAVSCRPPDVTYVASDAVGRLPELHREEILEHLTSHFGTPTDPRSAVADPEAIDDEATLVADADPRVLAEGMRLYQHRCAPCHGPNGDGEGQAAPYLNPRPRDFRAGVFKFTSTPYGAKPRRQDIERTVRRGVKGTAMPAFPWISRDELRAVVDYVILLSQRGETEQVLVIEAEDFDEDEPIDPEIFVEVIDQIKQRWDQASDQRVLPMTHMPPVTEATIRQGHEAFMTRGCAKCHGEDGRGQTDWLSPRFVEEQAALPESERPEINYDHWGNIAPAADLTAGMLHGGRRPIDIYRRIYSGINGTPMPAFGQALATEPETIWHLVHFIRSIVEGRRFAEGGESDGDKPADSGGASDS